MQESRISEINLSALTPGIGVEVRGVDLSQDLAAGVFTAIRNAWMMHKVAVFRDQKAR